ncbi:MAG: hypothetical protein WCY62_00480 [Clostridia bacterium]|jgi:hypothetical protein
MDNNMNEYDIIEQMEDLITNGKQTVFSDKVSISKDEMLDLIFYLKNAIKQRDQDEEAKNNELLKMIHDAKENQSVPQPQPQTQTVIEIPVIAEANKEANEIKRAALRYADELLANVQESIEKTLSIIQDNRNELK